MTINHFYSKKNQAFSTLFFVMQVIRELISDTPDDAKEKTIVDCIVVKNPEKDLLPLARTESRVFLLYGTRKEATEIMKEAKKLGLTKKTYVWIGTQAVIGSQSDFFKWEEFPVGMLGVHFKTGMSLYSNNIN